MSKKSISNIYVVVPNWNGKVSLRACLDSLLSQSLKAEIVVVENGSRDGSLEFLQKNYPGITVLPQPKNLGFAGGVNVGVRYAMEKNAASVALFNNDALADKYWLQHLVDALEKHPRAGIAACKLMTADKSELDSTGDLYTSWGLPFPRGRGEAISDRYDQHTAIFGASGGASLYRISMLEQIGLFDEDFFAYYEDVDLSFRAQLAGWKVLYVPAAAAYHQIGATSSTIKGFTTYQTMKNLPLLFWKNAPLKIFWLVLPRFTVAYTSFGVSAIFRGNGWPAIRGYLRMLSMLPKKTGQRFRIQKQRVVTVDYIWSIMTHDLPPNARKLRLLFHPIRSRKAGRSA